MTADQFGGLKTLAGLSLSGKQKLQIVVASTYLTQCVSHAPHM